MWSERKLQIKKIFCLLILVQFSNAAIYQFLLENEEVFTDCQNQPKNFYNKYQFFDFSELNMIMESDLVSVSGNITTIWEIQQADRVQIKFVVYRFDRGTWVPTVFSLTITDLCSILYDPSQHWYNSWTKHIINAAEVKDKCINVPGTKLIHEPYDLDLTFEITGPPMAGRHKIVMIFEAYDQKNKQRETNICMEIFGELVRIH